MMTALALFDGQTAAALEALLFARQRALAGDERARTYLADVAKAAVAYKDACGELSVVMSSSPQVSPLNRITSLKEGRRSKALRLLKLWNCVGQPNVAKPRAKPGSCSAAEWEQASSLKRLLQEAGDAGRVEQLLVGLPERVTAIALSMQALDELVTDDLLMTHSYSRRALQDEVCSLFPLLMSGRMQGLTPEGLLMLIDRAIGLPTTRNQFSYRRALKDKDEA
jgi:hypothetical protein